MRFLIRTAVFAAFVLWPHVSYACQCGHYPQAREAAQRATAVFEGTVVERWPTVIVEDGVKYPTQRYTFVVHRAWKGVTGARIQTLQGASNCSHWFETAEKYLVFAAPHQSDPATLHVHKCSGPSGASKWATAALEELGPPAVTFQEVATKPTSLVRMVQHAAVYFVCGRLAVEASLRQPTSFFWPLIVLVVALTGFAFSIRAILRHTASLTKRAMLVLFSLALFASALVMTTGIIFVQLNGWWSHLLEGWTSM